MSFIDDLFVKIYRFGFTSLPLMSYFLGMKNTIFILAFFLHIAGVMAQPEQRFLPIENYQLRPETSGPRVLSGRIINGGVDVADRYSVAYYLSTVIGKKNSRGSIPVLSDGTFTLFLEHDIPMQEVVIHIDSILDTRVIVDRGATVEIDIAAAKRNRIDYFGDGLIFGGEDAELNRYINRSMWFERDAKFELEKKIGMSMRLANSDQGLYKKRMDSIFDQLRNIQSAFIRKNPSIYSKILEQSLESRYLSLIAVGGVAKPLDQEILRRFSLHQPISLTRDDVDFYRYLGMYVDAESGRKSTQKWIGKGSIDESLAKLHFIDSLFPGTKGDVLKLGMLGNDPDMNSQLVQIILPSMTSYWCQRVLRKSSQQKEQQAQRVNTLMDKAQRSNAFPIALKAIDHTIANVNMFVFETGSAEDLLVALKQAFPGKALYIDCWATWCAPCIVEFPFSKALQERSKELPVEFVYLCIDDRSTVDKWKDIVAKHQLNGTHIYVKYSIMSAFMGMFSLSGYPSYILFDSKGKNIKDFNRKPSSLSPELLKQFLQ